MVVVSWLWSVGRDGFKDFFSYGEGRGERGEGRRLEEIRMQEDEEGGGIRG